MTILSDALNAVQFEIERVQDTVPPRLRERFRQKVRMWLYDLDEDAKRPDRQDDEEE